MEINELQLSESQLEAQEKICAWFQKCRHELDKGFKMSQPIFYLYGYAGTGKTTLIGDTIQKMQHPKTCFAAYTGKAALVMTRKGTPASTIHSTIYKYVAPDRDAILQLEEEAETADGERLRQIHAEIRRLSEPHFELNEESALTKAELFCVDEMSMAGMDIKEDMLWFKVPLLVIGDPGQLPPIKSAGAFIVDNPDVMLTEIHRQAEENPIIVFATNARKGFALRYGVFTHPDDPDQMVAHIPKSKVTDSNYLAADQILTGKHVTRMKLNTKMRELLKDEIVFDNRIPDFFPHIGDKLICLKNDKKRGLFNGMFAKVVGIGEVYQKSVDLQLELETEDTTDLNYEPKTYSVFTGHFELYHDREALNNCPYYERAKHCEFDFGYCITVHKSQGSQWDKVLLIDDGFGNFRNGNRKEWLYTALTRASKALMIGG